MLVMNNCVLFQHEMKRGQRYLEVEMGRQCKSDLMKIPDNFTDGERKKYTARFHTLDKDKKGYITPIDLRKYLEVGGNSLSGSNYSISNCVLTKKICPSRCLPFTHGGELLYLRIVLFSGLSI